MNSSPGPSTEETPLHQSPLHDENDEGIVQKLDGHCYALNPARFAPPPLTLATASWTGLKLASVMMLSPVLVVGSLFSATVMYMSPKRIQDYFLAPFLFRICSALDVKFARERKQLLANVRGRVLDLGSGSGAYLRYLGNAESVVALEPIVNLHAAIQTQADKWLSPAETEFELLNLILESYLEQYPEQIGTFDWIILGNVMCEVPDPHSTLRAVDRALTTGGKVYFSEHVACCDTPWKRSIQNLLNPWWTVVSGGCNMNRDTLKWIQTMPDWHVIAWEFPHVTVGLGPFVMGLAQKGQ